MPITLDALRTALNGSVQNGQLTLALGQLQSSVIDQLAPAYFPNNTIHLSAVPAPPTETSSDDGRQIIFSAQGQGVDVPFKNLTTTLLVTFFSDTGDVRLRMTATAQSGWVMHAGFPSLDETFLTDLKFAFTDPNSAPTVSFQSHDQPGLTLTGLLDLAAMTGGLSALTGRSQQPLSGSVKLAQSGQLVEEMNLVSPVSKQINLGIAEVDELTFEMGSHLGYSVFGNREFPLPYIGLSAEIPFTAHGKQRRIPVAAELATLNGAMRFSLNLTEGVDALLDEISALASESGLADALNFRDYLPTDNFKIEDNVKLSDFFFDVDPSATPKLRTIGFGIETTSPWDIFTTASGMKFTLAAVRLAFRMAAPFGTSNFRMLLSGEIGIGEHGVLVVDTAYPQLVFQVHLKDGTALNLAELFQAFLGSQADVPLLSVDELELDYHSGSFSLACNLAGLWEIPDTPFFIEDVRVAISEAGGVLNEALVYGQFRVGSVDISISASHPEPGAGWQFEGRMLPGAQINLTELVTSLVEAFGASPPTADLPEIVLSDLEISFNTQSKAFTFQATTDAEIPGLVQLGNQVHGVKTTVHITSDINPDTQQRRFRGFLRGEVMFGTAVFQLEYDFNEDNILKASWDSAQGGAVTFNDLTDVHNIDHTLQPPSGMELTLTRASLEFNLTQGRILLSAQSARFGEAFFIASNANGRWDFVFGILVRLDQIPGFPDTDVLEIESISLLLSTVQDDRFQVPSLPAHPVVLPDMKTTIPATRRTYPALGANPIKLRAGVSVAGVLKLAGSSNVLVSNLHQTVGAPEIIIQAVLANPISQSMIFAELLGGVRFSLGGENLSLSNVVIQFGFSPLSLLLAGSVLVPIQSVTLEATGALAITETEMEALLDVKATQDGQPADLPFPFGLLGVRLSELGVGVGAVFAPPGVDLALEGKFNVIGQPPGINSFTLVMELIEEVPDPLLLSTYIETITVQSLLTAVTGETVSDLPEVLQKISASELSVYWSEEPGLALPDGTLSQAGFGFNGLIEIGSFTAHAELQLSSAAGARGSAELAPIHLPSEQNNLVSITGKGQGVTVLQENINGVWVKAQSKPFGSRSDTHATRNFVAVPPGGATVAFNSSHSPYIDVSVQVKLFNLFSEDVEVTVGTDGFSFLLDGQIGSESVGAVAHFEVTCAVNKSGFHGRAELDVDLKGDIGPIVILGADLGTIHLDVVFSALLDIRIDAQGFSVTIDGKFWFDDLHLTMPTLTLQVDFKTLEELPAKIVEQIGKEVETIFKDLFDEAKQLLNEAQAEAEHIGQAVVQAVEQIEQAAEAEAQRIVADAGRVYETIVAGIADVENEAVQLEHEAEQIAQAAVAEVAQIAQDVAAEVETLEREAEAVLNKAAAEVSAIEQAVEAEFNQLAAEAEQILDAAAAEAQHIAQAVAQEVSAIAQAAEDEAKDILRAAENLAEELLAEADRILDEIEEAAKSVVHWVEREAEDAWDTIKKY
ncbi:MAG TPA: hypothetical protein VJG32_08850 [Anaerolineae bacterium]|nr:hypothetical protein [Anaerolineae bacterium]